MAKKMLPPTQADVDEAALDGVQLVQELGLQLDDEAAKRVTGRTSGLLTHAGFLSLLFLYSEPIIDGWKRST
jgi:hypothetical protein